MDVLKFLNFHFEKVMIVLLAVSLLLLVLSIIRHFLSFHSMRIISKPVLSPLSPAELPPVLTDAYHSIAKNLDSHQFQYIGDFTFESLKGSTYYYRIFKEAIDNFLFYILVNEIKNGYCICLKVVTWFENGNTVISYNDPARLFFTTPTHIYRHFPACMPADLVKLHKEYTDSITVKTHKKKLPEDKSIPGLIMGMRQEGIDYFLQKRYIRKCRDDERYLRNTLRGSLSRFLSILDNTHFVKDKPYDRRFKNIVGSTLYTHLPVLRPRNIKKLFLRYLLIMGLIGALYLLTYLI